MSTSVPTRKEDVKDPIGITGWPNEKGRDGERTPMQWDASTDAGFSKSPTPWLPLAADYKTTNVKAEESDPASLLNWYKQLIAMRRSNPALLDGAMTMLDPSNPSVLSFVRKGPGGASVVVAVNCTAHPQPIALAAQVGAGTVKTLMTDAAPLQAASSLSVTLPPFASWIASVQ